MKLIALTSGKFAIVDDVDFDLVKDTTWIAHKSKRKERDQWYAVHRIGNGKELIMHRLIINAPVGMMVDHRDGNGLNNQRSNLRLVNHILNGQNRVKSVGCASRFKGLVWRDYCWLARITVNKSRISLGYFKDEVAAAKAYDEAAIKYFGEFALPNFQQTLSER